MKNDTSNIIDLDNLLDTAQPEIVTESVAEKVAFEQVAIEMNEILEEWSYRLPKGFPTVVDGVFTERGEVEILNQLLEERGLEPMPLPEGLPATQLSSNPTDVKEALVCLFIDAILSDNTIENLYKSGLDKKLDPTQRAKISKAVQTKLGGIAKKYGKNYGIAGYTLMGEYVGSALSDIKANKTDIVIINNGLGAALAVLGGFNQIKPGMVHRDQTFNAIRSHAVKLIETNYNIKGYYPDNWCPGDIYIFLDDAKAKKALTTTKLNVGAGSLNSFFYGSSNNRGPIIAISLKMQQAQAGKATTFIKNVVVDGVTKQDKLGKDVDNQQIIKLKDLGRRLNKYYFDSDDWKRDEKVFSKVRQAVIQLSKVSDLTGVPIKTSQAKEMAKYLNTNKDLIQKKLKLVVGKLGKSIDTATTFQQAYTRFVNNLKSLKVEKVEGNSKDFIKSIEEKNKAANKGKLDQTKVQALLSQKAATYDLASALIEKWTQKTKKVSPAFAEYLNSVKNPFIAITMFAIAQHGLNPNFYKAIGRNDGATGILSEFPSNSTVDEKKSIQNLKIIDSPGQAGFYINYLLNINNHTYRTTLVFRFSKDAIRIEVEELTAI